MPDLTGNNVSFSLRSLAPGALPELTMSLSLLKEGALNMRYTYNRPGSLPPFEVPSDIIDVNRTHLSSGVLSDYVKITNLTTGV
jgi:hypothetical protein